MMEYTTIKSLWGGEPRRVEGEVTRNKPLQNKKQISERWEIMRLEFCNKLRSAVCGDSF
jgi:hypothetical protein